MGAENFTRGLSSPLSSFVDVTPDDDTDLDDVARALYVGTTGDVELMLEGMDAAVVLHDLAAGIWHPMMVKRVLDTNTTATDIAVGY